MTGAPPISSPAEIELARSRAKAEIERRRRAGTWSQEVAHSDYAGRPVDWLIEKLGIPENTIRWSKNPEYQCCYCPWCVKHKNEGKPHLWDGDVDPLELALNLLFQGKSIACSSGTGLGKSYVVGAGGTLAFLAIYTDSIVNSLAPKHDQLLKNMWKEIGNLWPRFKVMFPHATILSASGTLRMKDGKGEEEVWTATALGAGVGANEELAGKLKGFHHPRMMWLLEELQALDPAIVNTVVKTCTGNFNPIGGLGNPSSQQDQLALFGARNWVTDIRLSGYDFPNVVCGRDIIPGARTRETTQRDLDDANGNEDDPIFKAQVRGIAPAQARNALIQKDWLDAAAKRCETDPANGGRPENAAYRMGLRALGIDLADSMSGDRAAISSWQGAYAEVEAFKCADASKLGEDIVERNKKSKVPVRDRHVGIDSAGIGGPVFKAMRRHGMKGIRPLNGGSSPLPMIDQDVMWSQVERAEDGTLRPMGPKVTGSEKFDILRSQIYWLLREDLRLGRIALKYDKMLWDELLAMTFESEAGEVWVHEKKEIRKKIGRSPDMADALAYGNFVRDRALVTRGDNKVDRPLTEKGVDRGLEKILETSDRQAKSEHKRFLRQLRHGRKRSA